MSIRIDTDLPPPLEVAFLGGGINSAVGRAHRAAIELDRAFRVAAGSFSRNAGINRDTAREYGVAEARTYADLETLLAAEAGKVDAVVVLTPTDCHREHIVPCLAAGVPVISEKALATSCAEIAEIRTACEAAQGFLAVTYNYTGYPMFRELRRMIADGRLGRIGQIHVEMPQEGFSRRDASGQRIVPQAWRLHDAHVPTVSLDLGVHLHSLIHFLTGAAPLEVSAVSGTLGNFAGIVDNVQCLARYSDDLVCNFWYGKTALGYRNGLRVRVYGEKASAEWLQMEPETLYFADSTGHRCIIDRASPEIVEANAARYTRFKAGHPAGFIEAFANYYADVAEALRARRGHAALPSTPNVLGVEVAHEGMALLEAIADASASRSWVPVKRPG